MKVELTDGTELSQQLRPHAKYHVHGGLGQEVLLTEGSLPAFAAGLLPCLTPHRTKRTLVSTRAMEYDFIIRLLYLFIYCDH